MVVCGHRSTCQGVIYGVTDIMYGYKPDLTFSGKHGKQGLLRQPGIDYLTTNELAIIAIEISIVNIDLLRPNPSWTAWRVS